MVRLKCIFKIALITANVFVVGFGTVLGYFGVTYSDEINLPQGMDDEGLFPVGVLVLGYFGISAAILALIGVIALNVGQSRHKVFLAFVYGFLTVALILYGISGPIIKSAGSRELREMYDKCCLEYEECCVKDPEALRNMNDLHARYNCCGFDGPDYFRKLNRSSFPSSCCPQQTINQWSLKDGGYLSWRIRPSVPEPPEPSSSRQKSFDPMEKPSRSNSKTDCSAQAARSICTEALLNFCSKTARRMAQRRMRKMLEMQEQVGGTRPVQQACDPDDVVVIISDSEEDVNEFQKRFSGAIGANTGFGAKTACSVEGVRIVGSFSLSNEPEACETRVITKTRDVGVAVENRNSSSVSVEAKLTDSLSAIRVKDISLLMGTPLKNDNRSSSRPASYDSGVVSSGSSLADEPSADRISTGVKEAIRVRDIATLMSNDLSYVSRVTPVSDTPVSIDEPSSPVEVALTGSACGRIGENSQIAHVSGSSSSDRKKKRAAKRKKLLKKWKQLKQRRLQRNKNVGNFSQPLKGQGSQEQKEYVDFAADTAPSYFYSERASPMARTGYDDFAATAPSHFYSERASPMARTGYDDFAATAPSYFYSERAPPMAARGYCRELVDNISYFSTKPPGVSTGRRKYFPNRSLRKSGDVPTPVRNLGPSETPEPARKGNEITVSSAINAVPESTVQAAFPTVKPDIVPNESKVSKEPPVALTTQLPAAESQNKTVQQLPSTTSSSAKMPWTALSDTTWSSLFYK